MNGDFTFSLNLIAKCSRRAHPEQHFLFSCFKRSLRFFINALKSDNSIVSMLAKHLVSGSRSKSCQTLNYVCHCHGLDKFSLSKSYISRTQEKSTESDIFTAELVLDFLGLRSTVPDDPDITDVSEYLCTSWSE